MSGVSFGRVIALSAKPSKIEKLNTKLQRYVSPNELMIKDVTDIYRCSPTRGLLSQAARRGNSISIYITGSDVSKVQKKEKGWNDIKLILPRIESFYEANKMKLNDVLNKIF